MDIIWLHDPSSPTDEHHPTYPTLQLPITTSLMLRWPRGPGLSGLSSSVPAATSGLLVFDAAAASGMAQDLVCLAAGVEVDKLANSQWGWVG